MTIKYRVASAERGMRNAEFQADDRFTCQKNFQILCRMATKYLKSSAIARHCPHCPLMPALFWGQVVVGLLPDGGGELECWAQRGGWRPGLELRAVWRRVSASVVKPWQGCRRVFASVCTACG